MSIKPRDKIKLTRNQKLVYAKLRAAKVPLSAYNLLDQLRDDGLRAPPQVYRALEKLLQVDLVHRLESLNAFVACSEPRGCDHGTLAFAICEKCSAVTEFPAETLENQLQTLAQGAQFKLRSQVIELTGTCRTCALSTSTGRP